MSSPPPVLLTELRRCTRDHHDAIEALLALDRPLSPARYGAIVTGFDAFLRPFEAAVHAGLPPPLQAWYAERRRAPLVAQDIAHLGLPRSAALDERAAQAVRALPLRDEASVLGALYVIEGSALGGQVIGPRLAQSPGYTAAHGACYFNGFGDQTGPMWRDFRATTAATIGDHPAAARAACLAACLTFEALVAVFSPLLADLPAEDAVVQP